MPGKRISQIETELQKFLKKHPDTGVIELLIADVTGALRGKRIRNNDFAKTFKNGFYMPGAAVLLDTIGGDIKGSPWSSTDGDPDVNAIVVPGSLTPIPWAQKPSAQVMFRFFTHDGEPFLADSRHVLERAAEPVRKMGLKIVMAIELEFYLLDGKADKPTARVSKVPGIGRVQPGPQVFSPDDLWDIETFLNDLNETCDAQGIPAGTTTSEFSPGQFEINLQHVDDPVLACDQGVLLKRAIKAIARKHGLVACFMAKPFEEDAGSGMHVHMSLVDRNGKNYFSQGKQNMASPPFSSRLRHSVGGLAKIMAESTAIFAPNANSFRRLRPDMQAPVEPNWGANHRTVALRIPMSDEKNLRFEHRVPGADANPYLVTAAILAGVHYGLKNKCDPGRMVQVHEVIEPVLKIPNRWDAAIDLFSRSKILPQYLGEDFCKIYAMHRRDESRQFHNAVSTLDFDWYMRAV
ncbi:MAG: glutamine synthetase family protein [Proteobacteria bacterium]|nr:glutamine synthetase family protein [Pseudomonadota bacterium]MDA0994422.1 glutamine synthetase family protein [Pseudomonadota bacterium]